MVNSWMNKDGLYLKFGTSKADPEIAGEYKTYGDLREVEFELDLTTVGVNPAVISDTLRFPTGVIIQEIDVMARTAATGSGAVLNLGFIKADRTTELDYNGLLAAFPLASIDAVGETTVNTAGTTYSGALVGTALTDVGAYLTADYDTAAFTAGIIRVRIKYYGFGTITS